MKYNDVMIDIETVGTKPGCGILAIGATAFDLGTGSMGESFYANISIEDCFAKGLTADESTLAWWAKQAPEARDHLSVKPVLELSDALQNLQDFVGNVRKNSSSGAFRMWANDPDFDLVILDHAFTLCNINAPWQFWESSSTRTMLAVAKLARGIDVKKSIPRTGVHHRADDDAKYQAQYVCEAFKVLANV